MPTHAPLARTPTHTHACVHARTHARKRAHACTRARARAHAQDSELFEQHQLVDALRLENRELFRRRNVVMVRRPRPPPPPAAPRCPRVPLAPRTQSRRAEAATHKGHYRARTASQADAGGPHQRSPRAPLSGGRGPSPLRCRPSEPGPPSTALVPRRPPPPLPWSPPCVRRLRGPAHARLARPQTPMSGPLPARAADVQPGPSGSHPAGGRRVGGVSRRQGRLRRSDGPHLLGRVAA